MLFDPTFVSSLDLTLGNHLNGHVGLVHGGFTSALLDEAFGWGAGIEARAQQTGTICGKKK